MDVCPVFIRRRIRAFLSIEYEKVHRLNVIPACCHGKYSQVAYGKVFSAIFQLIWLVWVVVRVWVRVSATVRVGAGLVNSKGLVPGKVWG